MGADYPGKAPWEGWPNQTFPIPWAFPFGLVLSLKIPTRDAFGWRPPF